MFISHGVELVLTRGLSNREFELLIINFGGVK